MAQTDALYIPKLKKYFPKQNVHFIGEGWSSLAYVAGNKIVRIPKKGIGRYQQEQQTLKLIKKYVSVAVPQTEIIETPELTFIQHTKIEGNAWSESSFQKLNNEQKQKFADDIARFFTELHSIPLMEAQSIFLDSNHNFTPLEADLQIYELKNEQIAFMKELQNLKKDWCQEQVLLHTDFYPDNCVVNDSHRLCGVFDFADAKIGDSHVDFRRLYRLFGNSLYDIVVASYEKQSGKNINKKKVQFLTELEAISVMRYFSHTEYRERLPQEWQIWSERIKNFVKNLPEYAAYFKKCRQEEMMYK